MKRAKGVPHVILVPKGVGCKNCGEEYVVTFPVSINVWAAAGKAFESDHRYCKPSERGAARFKFTNEWEWIESWDTGVSSMTLWSVFTGNTTRGHGHGIPHDPADFGRCFRLLEALPAWRSQLAKRAPELEQLARGWTALVSRWDELEALWREEEPTGRAPRLGGLLQEILKGIPT